MLRNYQKEAIRRTRSFWSRGTQGVVLVSPTGSGKTEMGIELIRGRRALWVVHMTDLLHQTAERLRKATGEPVGIVQGRVPLNRSARIQVAMVQSLISRKSPEVEVEVFDECHHYPADVWGEVPTDGRKRLGLTATPERGDGRALGDLFEKMVVASTIGKLTELGHLVPAHTYRPESFLGGDVVMSASEAVLRYATNGKAFAFCPRVEVCHQCVVDLRRNGIKSAVIEYNTPRSERMGHLDAFRAGRLKALFCVDTLTEGIDVPDAEVAILARSYGHPGKMLQAVGRVLRPSTGKSRALVIDLSGTTHIHGLPGDEREYSLEGTPITSTGEWRGTPTGHGFCQEIVGGELIPAPGSPPLPRLDTEPPGEENERRSRWAALLRWAKKNNQPRTVAQAMYHQEFGVFP